MESKNNSHHEKYGRGIVVEEAEAFAKMFNEKISKLSADDRLVFMETFGKNTVLSSTETIAESVNNSPNKYNVVDEKVPINSSSGYFNSQPLCQVPDIKGNETTLPVTKYQTHDGTSVTYNTGTRKKKQIQNFENKRESIIQMENRKKVQLNTDQVKKWFESNDTQMGDISKNDQFTNFKHDNHQKPNSIPQTKNTSLQSQSRIMYAEAVKSQVLNVVEHKNELIKNTEKEKTFQKSNTKKSLNILMLGESGVGKSTWINAFANYLIYNSLEEAIAAETPICVIPTKFTISDSKNQVHDVILGEQENESLECQAESATQDAKTYLFETEKYNVYLIDTPGMNDTRNNGLDEENMQKILRFIASFKELHAICFLFKPDEHRLKKCFQYSIDTLLRNLSKTSLKNICIVFTNSQSNFYRPGSTLSLIKTYFKELNEKENIDVSITDDNVFCLDNEAFRFCCAKFGGVKIKNDQVEIYAESWTHSAQEINRLLDYAATISPHATSDTLSINDTRTWILQLENPTIHVSDVIQTNMQILEDRIKELKAMEINIEDLQKRSAVPIISLEIKKLNKPQTVCNKCAEYKNIDGIRQPIYKTVCHKDCFLPNDKLEYCL